MSEVKLDVKYKDLWFSKAVSWKTYKLPVVMAPGPLDIDKQLKYLWCKVCKSKLVYLDLMNKDGLLIICMQLVNCGFAQGLKKFARTVNLTFLA